MSSKLYQSVIQQMRSTTDRIIGVLDESANVIACSDLGLVGSVRKAVKDNYPVGSGAFVYEGYTYRPMGSRIQPEAMLFVSGVDAMAETLSGVLSVSLHAMREVYDEQYDRATFIKNLILENVLPGDIYPRSKELHFAADTYRVVIAIRVSDKDKEDVHAYDILQALFPERNKDFLLNLSKSEIVLIKEVSSSTEVKDLEKLARSVVDTINTEYYTHAVAGIGSIVSNLRDLPRSFKEAQVAIEVGKIFEVEKTVMNYNNLGIGRLIYYLPPALCNKFLTEVFKKGTAESLDSETMFTIQKFFENNLNISETSRKLFVHRNTLVYRLDKIKRLTGLDLKEFDDAIVFKVAMMVRKYMAANPTRF